MGPYVLSLDQGTTSSRALLVDEKSMQVIGVAYAPFDQIYPQSGYVEHAPESIWNSVKDSIISLLNQTKIDPKLISCIGITNQRETVMAFHKKTKRPIGNALVWQDRRTTQFCERLKEQGHEQNVYKKSGLFIDPYFSASKMNWMYKERKEVSDLAHKKELFFGTVDTLLLSHLTDGISFATDTSNASRTLLMNLETGRWDSDLLALFQIEKEWLCEIKDSFGLFGYTKNLSFLPDGIPITAILGDQQAALLGQACTQEGEMKCTYGTGAFMMQNIGKKPLWGEKGLLTTVAYAHKGEITFALEGSSYIAGAAVGWLRDQLHLFNESFEVEQYAKTLAGPKDIENLFFLPFFSGIGTPHWKPEAKGAILGLTREMGREHICYACLEGIAFSIDDLLEAFKKRSQMSPSLLRVDGGAASNKLLLQIQASVSNLPIVTPKVLETTAYGAAMSAMIGQNKLDLGDIRSLWQKASTSHKDPEIGRFYEEKKERWKKTIEKIY